MTKIYVVTVGEYSDYRIVSVYDEAHKAQAEELAGLIWGDAEEHELNPVVPPAPTGKFYSVEMCKDGKTFVRESPPLGYDLSLHQRRAHFTTNKDYPWERKSHWRLHWSGYADSEEHAVKITNELRMQILAGQCPAGVDMGENIPKGT